MQKPQPRTPIKSVLIVAYTERRYSAVKSKIPGMNCIWVYDPYCLCRRLPGKHYVVFDRSAPKIKNWIKMFDMCVDKQWGIIDLIADGEEIRSGMLLAPITK